MIVSVEERICLKQGKSWFDSFSKQFSKLSETIWHCSVGGCVWFCSRTGSFDSVTWSKEVFFTIASLNCFPMNVPHSRYENAYCWRICSHVHCFIHPSPVFNPLTLWQMTCSQELSGLPGKCVLERPRNHGLFLNPGKYRF